MRPLTLFPVLLVVLAAWNLTAQVSSAEQIEVAPPAPRVEAPSPTATAAELEKRGDELRAVKANLDALDYFQSALKKQPANPAVLLNKIGIVEMNMQRYRDSIRDFKKSIKADRTYADSYNNLGVTYYLQKDYKKAINLYEKALEVKPDSAAFYGNLGAAYFARKQPDKAMAAYLKALQLDPDVLNRSSRVGVVGQTTPAEERAYYDYVVAKAFAKLGLFDQSLDHLRKAMEEEYKDIQKVYKDEDFAALRKDPRFNEVMSSHPPALPN